MAEHGGSVTFDNILNFRDVAAFVNAHEKDTSLKPGNIYRCARPDSASTEDKYKLRDKLGVKTFIDLRSKTEHIEAARKREKHVPSSVVATEAIPNDLLADAVKIPGMRYAEINLNGKGFERHLVWQLRYSDLAWLVGYMVTGYRLQGISIIGKKVLQPRGLVGLGQDTLQHSGPEIRQVFDILGDANSYPVAIHCTQGKDRTGLIVMLVLLLCGVSIAAITNDYVKSESELQPEFAERMKEIKSIGLDESFAKCPSNFVGEMEKFLDGKYGGVEQYLRSIGVKQVQIDVIRKQLGQANAR